MSLNDRFKRPFGQDFNDEQSDSTEMVDEEVVPKKKTVIVKRMRKVKKVKTDVVVDVPPPTTKVINQEDSFTDEVSIENLDATHTKNSDVHLFLQVIDKKLKNYGVGDKKGQIFGCKLRDRDGHTIKLECFGKPSYISKETKEFVEGICERLNNFLTAGMYVRLKWFHVKSCGENDVKYDNCVIGENKISWINDEGSKSTSIDEMDAVNFDRPVKRHVIDMFENIAKIPEFYESDIAKPSTSSTAYNKDGIRLPSNINLIALVASQDEPRQLPKSTTMLSKVMLIDDSDTLIEMPLWNHESKKRYKPGSLLLLERAQINKRGDVFTIKSGQVSVVDLHSLDKNNSRIEVMQTWAKDGGESLYSDIYHLNNLSLFVRPVDESTTSQEKIEVMYTSAIGSNLAEIRAFQSEANNMIQDMKNRGLISNTVYEEGEKRPPFVLPKGYDDFPQDKCRVLCDVITIEGLQKHGQSNLKEHSKEQASFFYPSCSNTRVHGTFCPKVTYDNEMWRCTHAKCMQVLPDCNFGSTILVELSDGCSSVQIWCYDPQKLLNWVQSPMTLKELILRRRNIVNGLDESLPLQENDHIEFADEVVNSIRLMIQRHAKPVEVLVELKPSLEDGVRLQLHSIRDAPMSSLIDK